MRVAVIGIGGVGTVLAKELLEDRGVSSLLLLDKSIRKIQAFRKDAGRRAVETGLVDARRSGDVAKAIRGSDVVVNTALPACNLSIMRAALDAGTDYVDVAGTGPRRRGGPPGILEQLGLDESFRREGRRALLSMGLDPGISNVMAREAADRLDAVDEIRIRSGGSVRIRDGASFPKFVPLYSREAFFSDMRIRPTVWQGNRLVEYEPLSLEEDYSFPPPVGTQKTFLIAHEEVKTLPLFLGKPVARVDFKYAVHPDLAQALRALENLGLFGKNQRVAIDHRRIPFRAAFESVFPEPALIARRLEGTKCLSVDVDGVRHGVRRQIHEHVALAHREANRRRRTTAVYYLTGVAAAIGVKLLRIGTTPRSGVFPAESLDPRQVFVQWKARGLPITRRERSALS